MKTKEPPRSTFEVEVEFPDLGLTQKQLDALKRDFKNLLVATLGAKKIPLTTKWRRVGKHRRISETVLTAKKTGTT